MRTPYDRALERTAERNAEVAAAKKAAPRQYKRGAENRNTVLDWDRVDDIRARLLDGVARSALAMEHGVNYSVIRAIELALTWKLRPDGTKVDPLPIKREGPSVPVDLRAEVADLRRFKADAMEAIGELLRRLEIVERGQGIEPPKYEHTVEAPVEAPVETFDEIIDSLGLDDE